MDMNSIKVKEVLNTQIYSQFSRRRRLRCGLEFKFNSDLVFSTWTYPKKYQTWAPESKRMDNATFSRIYRELRHWEKFSKSQCNVNDCNFTVFSLIVVYMSLFWEFFFSLFMIISEFADMLTFPKISLRASVYLKKDYY
jgi:hypothetical protein